MASWGCHTDGSRKAYRWSYRGLKKIYVMYHDSSYLGMQDLAVVRPLVRSKATNCPQVTRVTWHSLPIARKVSWSKARDSPIPHHLIWMTRCYIQTKSFVVFLEQLGEQNLIDTYVTSWRLTSLPVAIPLSTKFHRQPNSTMNASLKFPILIRILKPPAGAVMCRLGQA